MKSECKVAVITGASQGIGASMVEGFRRRGYAVVANSRSIEASDFERDQKIVAVPGDIALPATADHIVDCAMRNFGRIDTLVNNAGIFIAKPFVQYTEVDFVAMVAVNLTGFFHLTQRVATPMLETGSGHIVTITAAIAEQPMSAVPAALAALTKGGLNAATRSLAIEFASRGVRVNAVSPGVIKTPMHQPEAYGFLAGLHPTGRIGEPHEIAEAVLYLEAAAFVTGEILRVDGGAHAGRW